MSWVLTVTGTGAARLSQTTRPPTVAVSFVRGCEPSTVGGFVLSSTNVTLAERGFTSGTPIGSDPDIVFACRIDTRAWALMKGRFASRKNHGRSVSVIFTSIICASQGCAVLTVSSVGEDWP